LENEGVEKRSIRATKAEAGEICRATLRASRGLGRKEHQRAQKKLWQEETGSKESKIYKDSEGPSLERERDRTKSKKKSGTGYIRKLTGAKRPSGRGKLKISRARRKEEKGSDGNRGRRAARDIETTPTEGSGELSGGGGGGWECSRKGVEG